MKRREFVAAGVSAACVGVVGASGAGAFPLDDGSRPDRLDGAGATASEASDSTAGSATDESAAASATDESAAASATDEPDTDSHASDDDELAPRSALEVFSTTSGETPVRFRLVRASDDAVVHDDVRHMAYGERAYLSGRCERGETYVFTLAVDGATLVHETVSPGERAIFELLDETTVSVVA